MATCRGRVVRRRSAARSRQNVGIHTTITPRVHRARGTAPTQALLLDGRSAKKPRFVFPWRLCRKPRLFFLGAWRISAGWSSTSLTMGSSMSRRSATTSAGAAGMLRVGYPRRRRRWRVLDPRSHPEHGDIAGRPHARRLAAVAIAGQAGSRRRFRLLGGPRPSSWLTTW